MSIPRVELVYLAPDGEHWRDSFFAGRWSGAVEAEKVRAAYRLAQLELPPDCVRMRTVEPEHADRLPRGTGHFATGPRQDAVRYFRDERGNLRALPEDEFLRRYPNGLPRPLSPVERLKRRRKK